MRFTGHDFGADHLVWAAGNKAWTQTAAMFDTETLADRGSGAVRHGARLLLLSAMSGAMRFFNRYQPSGAACKLALSICTMLVAESACCSKSGAAFHRAHFRAATAVLDTPSSCSNGRGAPFPRADWFGLMLVTETTACGTILTPFISAESVGAMIRAQSFSNSVVAAT